MTSPHLAPSHAGLELILGRIIQDFMRYMKQTGLSTPQINALLHIYHAGECQVSDISTLTDVSPAAASQLVERLVQQNLVERTEDPQNRRTKILRLSDQGMALIRNGVFSNHFLMDILASLNDEQRQTLQDAFDILAQAAQHFHSPTDGVVHRKG